MSYTTLEVGGKDGIICSVVTRDLIMVVICTIDILQPSLCAVYVSNAKHKFKSFNAIISMFSLLVSV